MRGGRGGEYIIIQLTQFAVWCYDWVSHKRPSRRLGPLPFSGKKGGRPEVATPSLRTTEIEGREKQVTELSELLSQLV